MLTKAKAISRVSGVGQFVTSVKHRLLLVYIYITDLWLSSMSMGKKKKAEKMVTSTNTGNQLLGLMRTRSCKKKKKEQEHKTTQHGPEE